MTQAHLIEHLSAQHLAVPGGEAALADKCIPFACARKGAACPATMRLPGCHCKGRQPKRRTIACAISPGASSWM
jgi:hypothetical protein